MQTHSITVILVLLFLLSFFTFGQNKKDSVHSNNKKLNSLKTNQNKPKVYIFSNDSITQIVKVKLQNNRKIDFLYNCTNTVRKKFVEFKGIAKTVTTWGCEIDEDEDGSAYPSFEYWYSNGNCELAFRIGMGKDSDKMIIKGYCKKGMDKFCPIESLGILRKSKK